MKILAKSRKNFLIIIYFFISSALIWSIFKLIVCKNYYGTLSVPYLLLNLLSLSLIIIIIINNIKKNIELEKLFLLIIIPIGLAFLFLQPPNFKPDEPHHLFRSYDIGINGNLMPEKDEKKISKIQIPVEVAQMHGNNINNLEKLNENLWVKIDYDNLITVASTAASSSPVAYVFSSIGLKLAKTFDMSWFMGYYLARLLNFVFTIIVSYYAIKITPIGKLIFFIFLLNPMFIHQATAISSDVLLNTLSVFLISYILNLKYIKETVKYKDCIFLISIITIISLIKIPYIFLLFTLLLIPKKKMEKKKFMFLVLGILLFLILLFQSQFSNYSNEDIYIIPAVNALKQFKYILLNPLYYIKVLFETFMNNSEFYLASFAGKYLAWVDVESHSIAPIIYIILLSSAAFIQHKEDYNDILNKREKILLIAIFSISILGLLTGIYISWTPVQNNIINGVQGRYFIPIAMLGLLALQPRKKLCVNNVKTKFCTLIIAINIIMLLNLINVYI